MTESRIPSPQMLRHLISYNPDTGELTWKERWPELFQDGTFGREATARAWNTKFCGKPALTTYTDGYLGGNLFGVRVKAHRIAWAVHTGYHPAGFIDHINRVRSDNRFSNLRVVTPHQNMMNTAPTKGTKSRYKGVSWKTAAGKWTAAIGYNREQIHLGTFESEIEAARAYNEAAKKYFGEYAAPNSV